MSSYRTLLILAIMMAFITIQAQAYPKNAAPAAGTAAAPAATGFNKGKVIETMNTAGYTYIQLEHEGQKCWAAIPETQVKVGDEVELGAGMEMKNFTSKTLNRTFDSIIFSQGLVKN